MSLFSRDFGSLYHGHAPPGHGRGPASRPFLVSRAPPVRVFAASALAESPSPTGGSAAGLPSQVHRPPGAGDVQPPLPPPPPQQQEQQQQQQRRRQQQQQEQDHAQKPRATKPKPVRPSLSEQLAEIGKAADSITSGIRSTHHLTKASSTPHLRSGMLKPNGGGSVGHSERIGPRPHAPVFAGAPSASASAAATATATAATAAAAAAAAAIEASAANRAAMGRIVADMQSGVKSALSTLVGRVCSGDGRGAPVSTTMLLEAVCNRFSVGRLSCCVQSRVQFFEDRVLYVFRHPSEPTHMNMEMFYRDMAAVYWAPARGAAAAAPPVFSFCIPRPLVHFGAAYDPARRDQLSIELPSAADAAAFQARVLPGIRRASAAAAAATAATS